MIVANKFSAKFYGYNLLLLLGVLALCLVVLAGFLKEIHREHVNAGAYFLPVVMLGFIGGGIYFIRAAMKRSPPMQVDEKGISFGTEYYSWTDLTDIELTGKGNPAWYLPYTDTMTLEFAGGIEKHIYGMVYKNSREVKAFIKYVVVDKVDMPVNLVQPVENSDISDQAFTMISGSFLLNIHVLSYMAIIVMLVYFAYRDGDYLPAILLCGLVLIGLFSQGYYFKVSQKYFVIKNHLLPGYHKAFLIDDILDVYFETHSRAPCRLWLVTKDFKVRVYPSATLTANNRRALREILDAAALNATTTR